MLRDDNVGDCRIDVVLQHEIVRAEPIVRDTHEVSLRYSVECDLSTLADTPEDRCGARFFKLNDFAFTTLPHILL